MKGLIELKKKLTYGGGFPLVMSILALVLSIVAAAQEYIFRFAYNALFDEERDKVFVKSVIGYFTMEKDSVSVIRLYTEKAFILAIISFVVLVVLMSARKKKKLGGAEAGFMIFAGIACAIEPVMYIAHFFSNGVKDGLSDDNDGARFRCLYGLVMYALPLLICVFLIIIGLAIAIRLGHESFAVELEVHNKPEVLGEAPVMPVQDDFVPLNITPTQEHPVAPVAESFAQPVNNSFTAVAEPAPVIPEAIREQPSEPVVEQIVEPVIENKPTVTICPMCGKELALGAKFCKFCGAKIQ